MTCCVNLRDWYAGVGSQRLPGALAELLALTNLQDPDKLDRTINLASLLLASSSSIIAKGEKDEDIKEGK